MMADNDNTPDFSPLSPNILRSNTPRSHARAAQAAAEEASLAEGRAARRTLAVRTAQEVLVSPSALDASV